MIDFVVNRWPAALSRAMPPSPARLMALAENGAQRPAQPHEILQAAEGVLADRMLRSIVLDRPKTLHDYLRVRLAMMPHEVFVALFLDICYRLISYEELFSGTLNQTAVYPREIIKAALLKNAAYVVLAHNHPSGDAAPSRADEQLTLTIGQTLALVDIRLLDHLIVTPGQVVSLREKGLV